MLTTIPISKLLLTQSIVLPTPANTTVPSVYVWACGAVNGEPTTTSQLLEEFQLSPEELAKVHELNTSKTPVASEVVALFKRKLAQD